MRTSQFKSRLDELTRLSPQQLDDLRVAADVLHQRSNTMSVFDKAVEGADCPHCSSFKATQNGFGRGLQRYRCNACSWTFNAATNTPLSRLRSKEQFYQQGECLIKGLSIRAAAQEMGVVVSTAFRRRHRFLEAVVGHQPKGAAGIFETDEIYFRETQKGNRHLTRKARKRGDKAITGKGSKRDLMSVLLGRLRGQPHVADQALTAMTAVEATDALRGAAKSLGAAYHSVAVSYGPRVIEGVYHIQPVNSYHQPCPTRCEPERRVYFHPGMSAKRLQ